MLDRYAELGDVPSLTAVDVVDGACAGALRALGLTDPQCRLVLGTLFADRRDMLSGGDR